MSEAVAQVFDYLRRPSVPIAEGKTFGPLTTLQFAGITLDSITMQASLPQDWPNAVISYHLVIA